MRSTLVALFCAVLLVGDLVHALPPIFPGSVALGAGYNILAGDPIAASSDPGYTPGSVFNPNCASCFSGGRTFGPFKLPNDVDVVAEQTCSYSGVSFAFHDTTTYQSASEKSVTDDGGFSTLLGLVGARFSASSFAQKLVNATVGGEVVVTSSTGTCAAYGVSIEPKTYDFTESLTEDFVNGLATLPSTFNPLNATNVALFEKFIAEFGTHTVVSTTLGGQASQVTTFDSASFSFLQTLVEDIEATASASLLIFFGGSISASAKVTEEEYLAFATSFSSNETNCRPFCPPSGNLSVDDPTGAWLPLLQFEHGGTAAPIAIQLMPLEALLATLKHPAAGALGTYFNTSACSLTPGCVQATSEPFFWRGGFRLPTGIAGAFSTALVTKDGDDDDNNDDGDDDGGMWGKPATEIVLAGGLTSSGESNFSTIVRHYDGSSWSNATTLRAPAGFGTTASLSSPPTLVAIGGAGEPSLAYPSASGFSIALDDLSSVRELPGLLPQPIALATAVVLPSHGVIVVLGGFNGSASVTTISCISIAAIQNASSHSFPTPCPSFLPPSLPTPAHAIGAAATPDESALVIVGGCNVAQGVAPGALTTSCPAPLASAFITSSKSWTPLPPLLSTRFGHSLALVQNPNLGIAVIGGFNSSQLLDASVPILEVDKGAWTLAPFSNPWPRAFASPVHTAPNTSLLLGGFSGSVSAPTLDTIATKLQNFAM